MEYEKVPETQKPSGDVSGPLDMSDDETHGFLSPTSAFGGRKKGLGSKTALAILSCLNVFLLVISLALVAPWFYSQHFRMNPDIRRVWTYSPIHDLIDLELHDIRVNGSLFPSNTPSIARQLPNPEADAVWEEWELTRIIPLTRSQVIQLGKDPSTVAKLEDQDWGLGDDAYIGTLDVFHQLHCLNSLRQIVYGKYYGKDQVEVDGSNIRAIHVNHCVDILAQALQCSGNVNMLTSHWVQTQPWPFPDMTMDRKCIAFDKLAEWRKANSIDMEKYREIIRKPDGVKQRPAPDALYNFYHLENPNHVNGANQGIDFNF